MQSSPSSFPYQTPPSMNVPGIHGHSLEVTVVGCNRLKDTEWISRQDPYVCLEYGTTKFRTRTCTDGGKNPTFQQKFIFTLIEGLQELQIAVWNSNTLTFDDFIGSGKIQLHKVLSHGYDDNPWPIYSKTGRCTGETRVILHYADAANVTSFGSSAPQVPPYGSSVQQGPGPYPAYPFPYPYYMPNPMSYPPSIYPPPPQQTGYPPQPYPTTSYPTQSYPPLQATCYYTSGQYHGPYPPPPY